MVGVGVTEKGRFCSSFVPAKLVLIASAHFRNLDVPNKISKFTFAIFKPEIAKNAFAVNYAYNVISKKGLIVAKTESLRFSVDLANKFYQVHDGKFFHQRLVESITRGPVICSVLCDLEKQNAVRTWRDIIGPTKVYQAKYESPESLRAMFGMSDTRNGFHGSDSESNALWEISLTMPDFDVHQWIHHFKQQHTMTSRDPDRTF